MRAMLPGADRLRRALAELDGPGSLRSRLVSAGNQFLAAVTHSDEWPVETAAWAESIAQRLSAAGTVVETVTEMSAEEVEAAAVRLRDFCASFG
jgi:hypothetical protein